jgi:hypothetical protein
MSGIETVRGRDGAVTHPTSRVQAPSLVAGAFCVLLLAAWMPVLMVKVPAMIDYSNHVGRMYAIANLDHDPLLAQYYYVDWRLIPNLAMDFLVPALAKLTGIFTASRIFVLATMLLMVTGPFAVEAALFRRLSPWPLVGFILIYNHILLYGFLNFLFGVGLALWGIAAWIGLRERSPPLRLAVSLAFALSLFVSHLHALGIYGLTLLCYEVWRLRDRGGGMRDWSMPDGRRRFAADLTVFAVPFLVALGLMAFSPTSAYGAANLWTVSSKPMGAWFLIKNYWPPLDLAIAAGVIAAVVWGYRSGRLRVHPAAWYVLAASLVLYVAMPYQLLGSWHADTRLASAMLFVLIGMAEWNAGSRRETAAFCGAVSLVALVRFAVVGFTWHYFSGVVADFERSFQEIRPGSKILTTQADDKDLRMTYAEMFKHAPELAIAERSSFVPLAFTDPGKQILRAQPSVRDIDVFEGAPPRISKVISGEIDEATALSTSGNPGYYFNWRNRFDYVYVLYARAGSPPPAPELTLVYQGDEFQLYEVRRQPR